MRSRKKNLLKFQSSDLAGKDLESAQLSEEKVTRTDRMQTNEGKASQTSLKTQKHFGIHTFIRNECKNDLRTRPAIVNSSRRKKVRPARLRPGGGIRAEEEVMQRSTSIAGLRELAQHKNGGSKTASK